VRPCGKTDLLFELGIAAGVVPVGVRRQNGRNVYIVLLRCHEKLNLKYNVKRSEAATSREMDSCSLYASNSVVSCRWKEQSEGVGGVQGQNEGVAMNGITRQQAQATTTSVLQRVPVLL
jgi:hypothetical protein